MDTGEQMYIQITRHAGAKVFIITPPEKFLCIIFWFRIHEGNIPVPIYGLRGFVCWNSILPCTDRTLTIISRFDAIQLPNFTSLEKFPCLCKTCPAYSLAPHLH